MSGQLTIAALLIISVIPIIFIFRKSENDLTRSLAGFSIYHLAYVAILFLPMAFSLSIPNTSMNWIGKTLGIAFSLIVYAQFKPQLKEHNYIFRLPATLSIKKLAVVSLIAIVMMLLLTYFFSKSKPSDLEKLAYQLTMPGLDEELWRGIIIGLLLVMMKKGTYRLGHPAVWVSTLIFALGHAFSLINWHPVFAIDAFIITGALGYIMGWMTYYSKSILPALIFHNAVNFTTNWLEMFVL